MRNREAMGTTVCTLGVSRSKEICVHVVEYAELEHCQRLQRPAPPGVVVHTQHQSSQGQWLGAESASMRNPSVELLLIGIAGSHRSITASAELKTARDIPFANLI